MEVNIECGNCGRPCNDGFRATCSRCLKLRPRIVCLCGSTRFIEKIREKGRELTYRGKIVVGPECITSAEHEIEAARPELKAQLDELHLRKIDLADEVFIVNVSGYIGESTARELEYARHQGKPISFLEYFWLE